MELHIDGPSCIGFGIDLQQELQVRKEGDTSTGKPYVRWLAAKNMHFKALCPEVIASRKTVFQVRYLRWQVPIGSNRALLKAARTNYRHQVGSIIRGMPLVCSFKTSDPSPYGGVQAQGHALDCGVPM